MTADQGIFNNSGTSILQLGGSAGINIGKATSNIMALNGRSNANTGGIRFGNDTNNLAWNGTSLAYNNVFFRGGRLGVGTEDPQANFSAGTDTTLFAVCTNPSALTSGFQEVAHFAAGSDSNDTGAIVRIGHYSNDRGLFIKAGRDSGDRAIAKFGLRNSGAADTDVLTIRQDGGTYYVGIADTSPSYPLDVNGAIRTTNRLTSTVATGTAPLSVSSTTEVPNLNAARLQGYTALGLPYLGGSVNTSINSTDGKRRFYFANNSYTAISGEDDIYFQIGTTSVGRMGGSGRWNFHGDSSEQTTYRVNVRGSNGLNIEATESLSSGQKNTVLRAGGDKQYIDSYGVFKRNRQTVAESITVAATDNCMSAGPITINNGNTITISNGGSWSIV